MIDFLEDQVSMFDADISFGKTYAEHTVATEAGTSRQSSRKSSALQTRRLLLFHCLKGDGRNMDATSRKWETGASPIVPWMPSSSELRSAENALPSYAISTDSPLRRFYLTLNCGERPRMENPTKLSEVLEENADNRYRLSKQACQGILNRAERRGKELPPELKETLERQVNEAI